MKKIKMDIEINASREAVWDAIVDDVKYRLWTSAFSEGSFFEGGWNKGDIIRFLMINKEGIKEGIVAEIAESIYPEFISIKHIGYVSKGVDDTTSDEIKSWTPAYENYTLEKLGEGRTLFLVEADTTDEYYQMFMELWPRALQNLKEVSEADLVTDLAAGI
ncbi:MAG TPA: SRPBCC domain-containing protein [Prolixibacteraceae bacterium]|nr:SRPBCC domain-containing protein [Prolixibacteraceae bacterium]